MLIKIYYRIKKNNYRADIWRSRMENLKLSLLTVIRKFNFNFQKKISVFDLKNFRKQKPVLSVYWQMFDSSVRIDSKLKIKRFKRVFGFEGYFVDVRFLVQEN